MYIAYDDFGNRSKYPFPTHLLSFLIGFSKCYCNDQNRLFVLCINTAGFQTGIRSVIDTPGKKPH